ncbi:MAG TPA: penicillin-binding protein 2 [Candidatus Paceibacterota bacterium]|nr:penicillin-binding protein 2 [Candidatus Paceibacterota bacterium]
MNSARFVVRIRVVAVIFALCALLIAGRLYVLQIMHGDMYAARADAQANPTTGPIVDRDKIYFTDKDGVPWAAALMQDIASTSERKRAYPGGSLAAQEIGFVAYNNDNTQKGRYGLEKYYDTTLSQAGEDLYSNFFVQLFGAAKRALAGDPQSGSVVTTIEPTVQAELERTLANYDAQWHPELTGGIIMNPQNGEIYAMAVAPTFDLNSFNTQKDPSIYANPMAQNVFEMGSIIKPLTMAAGIDSGVITPDSTYDDTGCITVNEKRICNYDGVARGVIPMQQILSQSLNVGASYVATKMGPSIMRNYFLNHYDLGQETGIDLPGEVHGLVSNIANGNQAVDFDTASFGQGIAITPIETVRALATLANGGNLVTPHFAKSIRYDTGITRDLTWATTPDVLKPQTVTDVTRMLTTVVDNAFAAGMSFPHYSVAAKTGTAQIANPNGGGYYSNEFLHSFFGYFPSYDAKFIVFLFAVDPKGAPYSSETWGTYFHDTVQFLINYYNVPPDR